MTYYDRHGQPISEKQWLPLHGDREYKIVARTEVTADVLVSTVWLGLDHSLHWPLDEPGHVPIIFETMVFGGPLDQEQWRYATEAQAYEGHAVVVGLVRRALSEQR